MKTKITTSKKNKNRKIYNKYKYKYIHFLLTNNYNFNKQLIDMFCEEKNNFNLNEHLFIIARKDVYEIEKKKCNIFLCEKPKYFGIDLINKYGDYGKWLFVHSFPFVHLESHIKKEYRNKILWRTWGHDTKKPLTIKEIVHETNSVNRFIRLCVRYLIETKEKKWKAIVNEFFAIGTANIVDDLIVSELFGSVKTYRMPYVNKTHYNLLVKNFNRSLKETNLNVMLGHSGYSDNHQKLITLLKKYENEKMCLHIPLGYGEPKYINKIINFTKNNWKGKVEILTDTIKYEEYIKYIQKMDIIILEGKESYALGNLAMALFYSKTLFLNKDGALYKGLREEGVPCHSVDEIQKMDFKEFSSLLNYHVHNTSSLLPKPYEESVKEWTSIYDDLENY